MFVGVTPAPTVTQEQTPVRRLIRTLTLFSALALVAAALVVLGPSPTPASAAGSRVTTTTLNCPTSVTVGATITCTVTVQDSTGKSRDRSNPVGTVAFSITTANRTDSFAVITPCTLVASGGDSATCTTARLVILGTGAPLTVRAAFTDTANVHTDSAGTDTVTATAPANPVVFSPAYTFTSGQSAKLGTSIPVFGAACTAAGGFWGQFVGVARDPLTETDASLVFQPLSVATRADGAMVWNPTIPAGHPTGAFYVRYYCASAQITSITDNRITYLFPLVTFSITLTSSNGSARAIWPEMQAGPPAVGALRLPFCVACAPVVSGAEVRPAAVVDPSSPVVRASVDPNALPAVDRVGLAGLRSAQLKARTDANEEMVGRVSRLAFAVLGRVPTRTFMDQSMFWTALGADALVQWNLAMTPEFRAQFGSVSTDGFVRNAYLRTTGRLPSASEVRSASWRLTSAGLSRIGFLAELAQSREARSVTATRTYVLAAYQALTTAMPSQTDLERFTGQLTDLVSKVQLVEDIALTRATPDRWNAAMSRPFGEWTRF